MATQMNSTKGSKKVVGSKKVGSKKVVDSKKVKGQKASSGNRRGGGRATGLTTEHTITEHWAHLLMLNEKSKTSNKMTDLDIHKAMNKEFPGRESKDFMEVESVQHIRNLYNRGILTRDENGEPVPPKTHSRQYDKNGQVVEVRRGRTPGSQNKPKDKGIKGGVKVKKLKKVRVRSSLDE